MNVDDQAPPRVAKELVIEKYPTPVPSPQAGPQVERFAGLSA